MIHRLIFFLTLGFALPSALMAAGASERYASCTEKVRSDPRGALAYAENWAKENDHPSARHCKALALYALKDYAEAAGLLQQISEPLKQTNLILWQDITQQVAKSWRYAGQMHRAIAALNGAIVFVSDQAFDSSQHAEVTLKLLTLRAEYFQRDKQPLQALQDYDHALRIQPDAHSLRLARGQLLTSLGERDLAREDANYLIENTPDSSKVHREARALLQ